MEPTNLVLLALGVVCLVNLVLTLRIVRRLRVRSTISDRGYGSGSEVAVGARAPHYHAMTLAGREVTDHRLAGHTVAFVFVSPNCSSCRNVLPKVAAVAAHARAAAGVELVVVSDAGAEKTKAWLDNIRHEDDVELSNPALVAPISRTKMIVDLNPQGLFPYFCVLNGDRTVLARGPVGGPRWNALVAGWTSQAARPAEASANP